MRIFLTLICFFIVSCNPFADSNSIIGHWQGVALEDGVMVFHSNGKMELLDAEKKSIFDDEESLEITWESIEELTPKQLYLVMKAGDKSERIAIGIYKVEKGQLFLGVPIAYQGSVDGVELGVTRYEMPKDFTGTVKVYNEI